MNESEKRCENERKSRRREREGERVGEREGKRAREWRARKKDTEGENAHASERNMTNEWNKRQQAVTHASHVTSSKICIIDSAPHARISIAMNQLKCTAGEALYIVITVGSQRTYRMSARAREGLQ